MNKKSGFQELELHQNIRNEIDWRNWNLVATLRETHDEHYVDGDETQEVAQNHPVDHDDERSHLLEASVSHNSNSGRRVFRRIFAIIQIVLESLPSTLMTVGFV